LSTIQAASGGAAEVTRC